MSNTVFVTGAQVKAAQILVAQDRVRGQEPDPATLKIAEARRARPADRGPVRPRTPPPESVRFWDALGPAGQEALEAIASLQVFRADEMLMRQGDPADEVVVILSGRVKISVEQDGKESVLAVRGFHQLVGERAAFHGSVRSATVTALEMVWAMVVTGEDFRGFIESHPSVMDILHDQLFDRLAEGRTEYSREETGLKSLPDPRADRAATVPVGGEPASDDAHRALGVLDGENCTVIRCGVAGLSDQVLPRDAVRAMFVTALPGIPALWPVHRGDGLLIVVPPSVSTAEVMTRLRKELPGAIEQYNRSEPGSVPIQLRLVVNVGPVSGDDSGVWGEGIAVASELLSALNSGGDIPDEAILAIVISPFVFETVILPAQDFEEEASYTQLPVKVRGSGTNAWLKVISGDLPAGNAQP